MDDLHVAFVLDGNRRWAVENQLPKLMGHHHGAKTLKKSIKWCVELGIKDITVYGFSTENFKRSEEETKSLFNIMKKYFSELLTSKEIHDNEIQVRFIGKLDLFPEDLQKVMKEVEAKTKDYTKHSFNLCVAYGGHEEIVQAANKAIALGKPITEEEFANLLYLNKQPDLVIRTGGAMRTSNFLPWQSAYSEWFFIKEHWPAFSKERLVELIAEFKERKRNFGK
ncbi:di-trans,poly-cis-decaprenylcistransferase [Candidatus Woesearchaeota archaeon]|nr:di-trans,poly-cis-decaprenylcistransferase [Candidatus Woesearchaeota archaeon]MBT4368443.1 di-trans,poly-cis-decaprenylcistransferase [Candidatus Woesearchaeota archaeon]MBT4712932.1 di-trans,poly-cis-decaprenylcistransferase [Candidatus Woesearchaeota archaeon]MBT6639844.1 di-trans,poly-cis-decaprenylcistransferase [Candidatus Woesearchaeota archaeon]MBT7134016.1 di-trans,poly-cis-decaprenylcistransferase [Candidatus Woesearchaeota archaeon]